MPDFSSTAQIAQAIFWTGYFFLFVHGYRTGDRLV